MYSHLNFSTKLRLLDKDNVNILTMIVFQINKGKDKIY